MCRELASATLNAGCALLRYVYDAELKAYLTVYKGFIRFYKGFIRFHKVL